MKYIYGPVPSRRLGYSLGIDLIPPKVCSHNCIYCQAGKTTVLTTERKSYIKFADIEKEIRQVLPQKDINYITFAGAGEPTLSADLGRAIDLCRKLAANKIAVITNSSLVDRESVRRDLAKVDLVMPSLDAVSQDLYEKINRPAPNLNASNIVDGLTKLKSEMSGKMFLEILLLKGLNDSMEEIQKLVEAVNRIKPDKVQLNTSVRPPQERNAIALPAEEMNRIKMLFPENTEIIGVAKEKNHSIGVGSDLQEQVFELIRRRSVTMEDLNKVLGIHKDVLLDILKSLMEDKKIKKVSHGGTTYFREFY